jgi:hypothetical protein
MALTRLSSNAQKYKGAGAFILERLLADGTPSTDPADIYTAGQNLIGVINTAWSLTTEELRDENNQLPRAVYNTGASETISIEMRSEDPYLDLFLKGGRVIKGAGVQTYADLLIAIPEGGVFTLKDPDGGAVKLDEDTNMLFRDLVTGEDYVKVESAPATGQFSVDAATGVLTFAAEDKGKRGYFTAGYKMDEVETFQRDKNASLTSYRMKLTGEAYQYDQTQAQWSEEIYPSVQLASGELASMARQLSPQSTKTLNFQRTAGGGSEGSSRKLSKIPVAASGEIGTAVVEPPQNP